ncbi:UNVERIFIED_CONTAM: hypothetical protein KWF18_12155 [Acinetobacter pittii]
MNRFYGGNMETNAQEVSSNRYLHVIKVNKYEGKLSELINKYLTRICEGEPDDEEQTDVPRVMRRLHKFLLTKNETTKMGAIAEFFIHLYLNDSNYKQEFLFFNLEEKSIKKGFDGVFTKSDEIYILESKSGNESTSGISHLAKVKEAYRDLKKYFDGSSEKGGNNPWRNAYNHASHGDIKARDSLKKQIRTLANLYDDEEYTDIKDYNIIPCSTIFLNENWNEEHINNFINSSEYVSSLEAKSVNVIILTKLDMLNFINFLELGGKND